MKALIFKRGILIIFLILLISACSVSPDNELEAVSIPTVFPAPESQKDDQGFENSTQTNPNTSNQNPLSAQLQDLNIDTSQFRVISSDQVNWSDTCLGIEQPGAECEPQETPGYLIVFEADGLEFEYHADQDGGQVQPATPALLWSRDGGNEEYCDKLIIYLPDTVHICWCKKGKMESSSANLHEVLSIEEYEQLVNALKHLDNTTMDQPDTDESQSAMVSLTFYGQGNNLPDSEEQDTLLTLAKMIFTRLSQ